MRNAVPMCSQTCIKDDDAVAAMETARGGVGMDVGTHNPLITALGTPKRMVLLQA